MRYASFILSVSSAALLTVACASSEPSPEIESSPTEPAPATTLPPDETPPAPPPTKQCAPSCKTDTDCQNSCPSVSGGVQCCDTSVGKCFAASSSTCPAPADPTQPAPAY